MFKFEDALNSYNKLSIQVKASFWFMICSFLQKGISILTTPIFTRLLTTEEYGQFNVFNSWLSILTVFITLHLSQGIYTQGLIKFSDKRDIYTSSLQGLTLVLTIFWLIIYFLFKKYWNHMFSLTTKQMTAMLLMIWATSVFNFWAAEQRVLLNYKQLVILTIIVSILKPLVSIIFVVNSNDKVTARIFGLLIVEIVCYSWLFLIHMNKGKMFYSSRFWAYALKLNIPLIPHYLSQTALNSMDRIMIEKTVGPSEAGIYSLAYSLSFLMTIFNTALMATLSPWIYQKIKDRKEKNISKVAYFTLGFVALMNLILIMFAPEIVHIFAPSAYHDAVYLIPPIAMSVYFLFSYDFFAKFEFYYEKTLWITIATIGSALLNFVTNYIFIGLFGYYAAAYTTLICYILYALFHYIMMKKICKDFMDSSHVFNGFILVSIAIVFIISGFIVMALYDLPIIRYLLIIIVLTVLFIFKDRVKKVSMSIIKSKLK